LVQIVRRLNVRLMVVHLSTSKERIQWILVDSLNMGKIYMKMVLEFCLKIEN